MSEGLSQNKSRIAITTAKGDMQGDICSAVLKEVGGDSFHGNEDH